MSDRPWPIMVKQKWVIVAGCVKIDLSLLATLTTKLQHESQFLLSFSYRPVGIIKLAAIEVCPRSVALWMSSPLPCVCADFFCHGFVKKKIIGNKLDDITTTNCFVY